MPILINRFNACDADFDRQLCALLSWESVSDQHVQQIVADIILNVRQRGDAALLEYTRNFDDFADANSENICLDKNQLQQALLNIDPVQRHALQQAAERIQLFHQRQVQQSWQYTESNGNILGQQVTALDSVGVYVPGGKAVYPSSVLMNIIPAKVAGVEQIFMVTPAVKGQCSQIVLAAAAIAGVDQVFLVGGAQAVAALAYGTQTIPKVDKIVGPGNVYVATAKRAVFGHVGIDMIAGPSEVVIVCDGNVDPDWIVMDLFSQAEHDENAQAILISDNHEFLNKIESCIAAHLPNMERREVIQASLLARGALIKVQNLQDAFDLSNRIAPEHLQLCIENAENYLSAIKHAGAIFVGRYTPEALGDYCAGPNHVLPTSATARFSSPLGVYDFQKRSSIIHCSQQGASELAVIAGVLARGEFLTAHARSAEYRIIKNKN